MDLGKNRKMFNFEPLDEEVAPTEPNVTVVSADQFDELVATTDVADEASNLTRAAANR